MQTINELINSTKGKFFTATFTKKDGTKRRLTGRTGVSKGVKGTGLKFTPSDKNLQVVWSCDAQSFRMINLETITQLTINKTTYKF